MKALIYVIVLEWFLLALTDLEPSQLLLFVQSFGIPVVSMSKLLRCLDQAVDIDSSEMEQAIVDKGYMAQLIEVQRMRGATGGDKFHRLLLNGELPAPGLYIRFLFYLQYYVS